MKVRKSLILVAVGFVVLKFAPEIWTSQIKLNKLKTDLKILKEKKNTLDQDILSYENEMKNLDVDFYKEKIVREKLKMVKDGEVIYKTVKK